jgi:phospholipid/cholesterol/gamma-HCH transport system substrate-binding protein
MESRANYIAVGAFVLIVLAGAFVSILWLARGTQFQARYKYYETDVLGPVTGLESGALVRLNGIEVGRVTRMEQDPDDPEFVRLILEVLNTAQIRADSVASLETLGLTGVDYIEISGGTHNAPLLIAAPGQEYPRIASRESSLQRVFENAPELLARLVALTERVQSIFDEKNRQAIADTLANMRDATAVVKNRSHDIDQLITDSGTTMHNLAIASASLQDMVGKLDRTSDKADRLVVAANDAVRQATKLVVDLDAVVVTAKPGLRDLTTNGVDQIDALLSDARRLIASLDRVSSELERNPNALLFGEHRAGYTPK